MVISTKLEFLNTMAQIQYSQLIKAEDTTVVYITVVEMKATFITYVSI